MQGTIHTQGLVKKCLQAPYINGICTRSTKADKKSGQVLNTRRERQKGKESHGQGLRDGSGKYTCGSHGVA